MRRFPVYGDKDSNAKPIGGAPNPVHAQGGRGGVVTQAGSGRKYFTENINHLLNDER